jgi:hypothetical protein
VSLDGTVLSCYSAFGREGAQPSGRPCKQRGEMIGDNVRFGFWYYQYGFAQRAVEHSF